MEMSYFSLPNYSMVFKNRRLSTHGGLILYIHDDFAYKELNNEIVISDKSNLFESILLNYGENRVHTKHTYLEMSIVLNLLKTRSNFIYLCGDYNIDILKKFITHLMKMSFHVVLHRK